MANDDKQFEIEPATYDAVIDWPKRLANEEPFYRRLFDEVGAERVLDAACGPGRHAAMFHSWGLSVEGADVDARMIEFCRSTHGESDRLRWRRRSFADPPPEPGAFDAVICVGNSLSLAEDDTLLERAVGAMLASLRPGGVCIVQALNLWKLPEGPTQWRTIKQIPHEGGRRLLLKGIHRVGDRGHVDLLHVYINRDDFRCEPHAGSFRGLRQSDLEHVAEMGGGVDCRFFGSQKFEPYARDESPDLIMVCKRGSE